MNCVHAESGVEMFAHAVPYLGTVHLCWDCRRELVLRTHDFLEFGLIPVDAGRLGYTCPKCKGELTSTDSMTCTCRGRKAECAANRRAFDAFKTYARLVLWKPKAARDA
jgi:hypothetical protein